MVDIEDFSESGLDVLHKFYQKLSDMSEDDQDIHRSHSIDAAGDLSKEKNSYKKNDETKNPDD